MSNIGDVQGLQRALCSVAMSYFIATALLGCHNPTCPEQDGVDPRGSEQEFVKARGTMIYLEDMDMWIVELDFEDLRYALTGYPRYLPADNLPDRFQKEGLRVVISGEDPDVPSNVDPLVWPLIVTHIEECEGEKAFVQAVTHG